MLSHVKKWLAAGLLVLGLWPQTAGADGEDLDQLIKGTWAMFLRGNTATVNSNGVPVGTPVVAIATVTFDGQGGCSSVDQIILDGAFIPERDAFRSTEEPGGACSYEVDPSGYGFFDVTFPAAGETNVTFVLTDRHELHFITTNPTLGIFGGGVMRRQNASFDPQ